MSLKPLKWYKNLSDGSARLKEGVFLVEGLRAIGQIRAVRPESIQEILSTGPAAFGDYPVRLLSPARFSGISCARSPQGIMAVVNLPAELYSNELPENPGNRVLILEDIQDPGNVGTLVRSAAGLGFSGIIMSQSCADPFSPKCVQASAGTVLSVWIRRTRDFFDPIKDLKEQGYFLLATSLEGQSDNDLFKHSRLALALGNEASGLSNDMLDMCDGAYRVSIDRKLAESLNVAAAGAICMYLARNS